MAMRSPTMTTRARTARGAMTDTNSLDELPQLPRTSWSKRILWLLAACALVLLAIGARRLALIEARELDRESEPRTLRAARELPTATRLSARLFEVELSRELNATFELCALTDLAAGTFHDAFEILILHAEASRLMLRVPLDAAHLKHVHSNGKHSCLMLGSGLIEHTGSYRIEAVWPKQAPPDPALDAKLWVRVQASPELLHSDLVTVCGLGAAVLLALFIGLWSLPRPSSAVAETTRTRVRASIAPVFALALLYLAMQWPSRGGLHTLFKGCGLLTLQLVLPLVLVTSLRRQRASDALGLTRLPRPTFAVGLALVAVPLLVAAARLAMRTVPSTEIAPIQTFIAWPSGMLSAALLGVLLPLGEELFFRGYLFGAWLRYGRAFAASASVLAFGLMHLEQSWGNWGGWLAICLTGSVLCGLRLLTGSACLPAISHVAYNLTLSLSTLAAAATS